MKAGKVRRSIQRFADFANDLLAADMNTFDDRLSLLIKYFENDELFESIHNQLTKYSNVDFDSWYEEIRSTVGGMVGSGDLRFPTDLDNRLSLMYQLLCNIEKERIEFFGFCSLFFVVDSSRYDGYICAFNQAISEPLFRELAYRLEDIQEELPENNKEEVGAHVFQIIQHAENVIQQNAIGNNNSQVADIRNETNELEKLFSSLVSEVKSSLSDSDEVKDHIETIETCKDLALAESPKKSVISKLLATLPALGSVASICSAILAAL